MSTFANVEEAFNKFAKYVIKQARTNLTKQKKNSSSSLYNSLGYDLKATTKSFSLEFFMEDYGAYIDEGVQGSTSSYLESRNSRFEYSGRFKTIPTKALDKWVVNRGIAPRDDKGRFVSRQSLKYVIAKSIYEKGIKASFFFTKPFEKAFDNLPVEIVEAFALDIDDLLEFTR
jgi:hypothetical protein